MRKPNKGEYVPNGPTLPERATPSKAARLITNALHVMDKIRCFGDERSPRCFEALRIVEHQADSIDGTRAPIRPSDHRRLTQRNENVRFTHDCAQIARRAPRRRAHSAELERCSGERNVDAHRETV